jgi:hypothetical protein
VPFQLKGAVMQQEELVGDGKCIINGRLIHHYGRGNGQGHVQNFDKEPFLPYEQTQTEGLT